MTVLVAFDGGSLSIEALERAREFAAATEDDLVAATVVPTSEDYAREKGWIAEGEEFSTDRVVAGLSECVADYAPEAGFRYELVDPYAPTGTIANRIRRMADQLDAAVVFVGSEDAGGLVSPLSSVGGTVSASREYDVYIAREADPERRCVVDA